MDYALRPSILWLHKQTALYRRETANTVAEPNPVSFHDRNGVLIGLSKVDGALQMVVLISLRNFTLHVAHYPVVTDRIDGTLLHCMLRCKCPGLIWSCTLIQQYYSTRVSVLCSTVYEKLWPEAVFSSADYWSILLCNHRHVSGITNATNMSMLIDGARQ